MRMSYSRFFMPLAEEAKGYDFNGRTPAGRCIVEARGTMGKLSLWAQDLKPQTKYGIYLVFVENRRHVGLHMGPLDVDTKGKAEIRRDIAELHSFALKDIVAVAVIATDAIGVVSPLCGYKDKPVTWRHGFVVYTAHKEEPPMEIPVALMEPPEPKELPEEEEATEPPVEEPTEPPELPEEEEATEPPMEEPLPTAPRATRPPATTQTPPPPTSQNTALLIESIFNANPIFEPFTSQDDNFKWVKCTELAQIPLPPDIPHLMTEPFMQAAWADHEHFILGVSEDNQYIIGIPGHYTQTNLQQAKQLGFTQFRGTKKDRPKFGDSGYWLMHVSF